MMDLSSVPVKPARKFLPEEIVINDWSDIEKFYEELLEAEFSSLQDLEKWLKNRSELSAVLEEELAWRYIKMNIDTTDQSLSDAFNQFITNVQPHIAPKENELNIKLHDSPFFGELDDEKYKILKRSLIRQIELFSEENVPLFTEMEQLQQKFGAIMGAISIEWEGKELTLQQSAKYLKDNDRSIREAIFKKRESVFWEVNENTTITAKLQALLDQLLQLRAKIAKNAGYDNYLAYKFDAMERFDYTIEDCQDFHAAIAEHIVPINKESAIRRKEELGYEQLKPWDLEVDTKGRKPLEPFQNGEELLEKSITCFDQIDPFFGYCLRTMKTLGHLDLESKKGKAPGGFNYPLYEIGVPFIYMNAVGTHRDVVTMVHEGGHAIHSFLSKDLELVEFKGLTSEIAELASMSMELISMEYWSVFFTDPDELKRAKITQLEGVLKTLPWIACIDQFQHWIYANQNHTEEQRKEAWKEIYSRFSSGVVDYSGFEDSFAYAWQKQLHIFEVPLYYIEYGMAQLGAIAMWRNFKKDPEATIANYKKALSLGYTKTIGEIYEAAGIKFDFSGDYIKELAGFIKDEIEKIN